MPFTLIQGTFKPDTGRPDGDTVRFAPNNSMLVFVLQRAGRLPKINQNNGTISLRYEGIDAMEKEARIPESRDATENNLDLLGITETVRETEGYILSKQIDPNGRPISFIFTGKLEDGEADGDSVFLTPERMKSSLNYQLIVNGNVYPLYYDTLFFDLRQELTKAVLTARDSDKGIWQDDVTTKGFAWEGANSLENLPPIFPKLWRRLQGYTQDLDFANDSETPDLFIDYLQTKRSDRVLVIDLGRFTGFDDVIEVKGNKIKLLFPPEELVFMS
jgi:endonuclease YncB( thermonuclease family)